MTMIHLFIAPGEPCGLFADGKLPELPAVIHERPAAASKRQAINPPRSATRHYSDSELSTAASMLAKLRLKHDVIDHVRSAGDPIVYDSEKTVDKVVDTLLHRLG